MFSYIHKNMTSLFIPAQDYSVSSLPSLMASHLLLFLSQTERLTDGLLTPPILIKSVNHSECPVIGAQAALLTLHAYSVARSSNSVKCKLIVNDIALMLGQERKGSPVGRRLVQTSSTNGRRGGPTGGRDYPHMTSAT